MTVLASKVKEVEVIKVAVLGAKGRMGSTTVDAVTNAADLELVAALDIDDAAAGSAALANQAQQAGAQVAVDFTIPSAAEDNVHALLDAGISVVVGTTGWTEESRARVAQHLKELNANRAADNQLGVLIAPNFGISAILTMQFAKLAAPYFESVEVIELHHPIRWMPPRARPNPRPVGSPQLVPLPGWANCPTPLNLGLRPGA